ESCTGGLATQLLTEVPGSSRWTQGAFVVYSNELKQSALSVPAELIRQHGAVSEPVVRAMAEGARRASGATWSPAITGIAGPDGGTPEKPVGTVWLALAGPGGTRSKHSHFRGDRGQVRTLTARPPNLNDWVFERGRWYVSFPPLPAVLMMPFVALWGLSFNDVAFTLPFAAANVALLYRLLRRIQQVEGGSRSEWDHAVFALVFGFGTLAWSCSIRGEVWFTAEVVGVTFTLLYLHAALR